MSHHARSNKGLFMLGPPYLNLFARLVEEVASRSFFAVDGVAGIPAGWIS
jgi:hypothetical protein